MREFEFRFNFLIWTTMDFVFLAMVFLGIELIFGQVQSIAGWSRNEVLLLVLTTALFNDFMWTFFHINLMYFSDLVRLGNLDFALLKPVNSRFLISCRYFEFDHYLRMVVIVYSLSKLLSQMGFNPSLVSWLVFFILFFLGLLIIYNFFFILTTTNIWFIKIFNFSNLFEDVADIARFPTSIFKGRLKYLFAYLIPTIFIAYFPVEFLLGRQGIEVVFYAFFTVIFFFVVSQWFWHFALKYYQGASS